MRARKMMKNRHFLQGAFSKACVQTLMGMFWLVSIYPVAERLAVLAKLEFSS